MEVVQLANKNWNYDQIAKVNPERIVDRDTKHQRAILIPVNFNAIHQKHLARFRHTIVGDIGVDSTK